MKIANEAIGKGAGTGGIVGVTGGALWGLACGPLAVLCVPLMAGFGSAVGTGAGAVFGLTGALAPEKAERLRARLGRVSQAHDLLADLRGQVLRRAEGRWDLAAEPAKAVVQVRLQSLSLTSTRDEDIGLVLQVQVVARHEPPLPAEPVERLFTCTPPPARLALWLDESSDYIDTTLSACTQQIAAQIVAELSRS